VNCETSHANNDKGLVKELADQILKNEHFARDADGKLHHYRGGSYEPDGSFRVHKLVKHILKVQQETKRWSSHGAREVEKFIQLDAPVLWECPPLGIINVKNGLLDIKSLTLMPHSAGHFSSVQLPVLYRPAADCPHWDEFINGVFPSDARVLGYQIPAFLMRPDMSLQKAVLLTGEGANGKSAFLAGLTQFLGAKNVCNVPLHRLESDKFAVTRLIGKLANICSDLPSYHLCNTSTFKAIVGGDRMLAEPKFQSSFEFTPFCRFVFSTNHFPRSNDSSQAFFRRWEVIPFERTFTECDQIPRPVLDSQLGSAEELSGLLNRALDALPSITTQRGFTQCESTKAAFLEFREQTDPLAAWLDMETVSEPKAIVTKKGLLNAYNTARGKTGAPPMTPKGFHTAVKRLRPAIHEAQRAITGKTEYVYLGLGLRSANRHTSDDSWDSHDLSEIKAFEGIEINTKRVNGVNAMKPMTHEPLYWEEIDLSGD
jgi:putative DNA primase/helicase